MNTGVGLGYYEEVEVASKRSGPGALLFASEVPRVVCEISRLSWSWGLLVASARRGDGHPVMVLPGFMAGDESTFLLRRFLTRIGYVSLPWLQGRNIGAPTLLEGAMRRFYRAHHAYGEKISLVGQSLGGVFAREIAREFPDAVRQVITLGSPFGVNDEAETNAIVAKLFENMSGLSVEEMRARMEQIDPREGLEVPSTAIYSKTDGVVSWQACVEETSAIAENVEVTGSHSGMAMNPDVLHVLADRLSQDVANWQPFDRATGVRGLIYPQPTDGPTTD